MSLYPTFSNRHSKIKEFKKVIKMAGSLVVIETDGQKNEKPVNTIKDQWQVQFARFIIYPSLPSTCPSLVPLPKNTRYRAPRGNWIATSSPVASLQIINDFSSSETILAVCLSGKILVSCSFLILLDHNFDCFRMSQILIWFICSNIVSSLWISILPVINWVLTVKNIRTNPGSEKRIDCWLLKEIAIIIIIAFDPSIFRSQNWIHISVSASFTMFPWINLAEFQVSCLIYIYLWILFILVFLLDKKRM